MGLTQSLPLSARALLVAAAMTGVACHSISALDEFTIGGHGAATSTGGGGGSDATGGDGLGGTAAGGSHSLSVQVAANNRDASDDGSDGQLSQCQFGDADWMDAGGYQWSLPVPQGATIQLARVSLYSQVHEGEIAPYLAGVRVEDADSAAAFNGTGGDIKGRSYWTTTVEWSVPIGGLPLGQWSDSPSLKSLIQHVVDRPGWQADNFLSIAIWGESSTGGSAEEIADYSANVSLAATLHVEYTETP